MTGGQPFSPLLAVVALALGGCAGDSLQRLGHDLLVNVKRHECRDVPVTHRANCEAKADISYAETRRQLDAIEREQDSDRIVIPVESEE